MEIVQPCERMRAVRQCPSIPTEIKIEKKNNQIKKKREKSSWWTRASNCRSGSVSRIVSKTVLFCFCPRQTTEKNRKVPLFCLCYLQRLNIVSRYFLKKLVSWRRKCLGERISQVIDLSFLVQLIKKWRLFLIIVRSVLGSVIIGTRIGVAVSVLLLLRVNWKRKKLKKNWN